MELRTRVPRKLAPLLKHHRYKGAYGGRGGAKSHFFAEQIVVRCVASKTRVVCIREVQNSIKDSVKQLLADKIHGFGLGSLFEIVESEIRGPNGSVIIFKGMQSYNAENIKSLEDYDIAWVEEAQTLSEHSLRMLRPTIRKDGSELWFSWNPRFNTDPVDKFFRKNPPPEAISIEVNWRDNPWFPAALKREMEHDFLVDEDEALHVWEGKYFAGKGTILARQISRAEMDGRLNDCEYDPDGSDIEISSDIGFRDTASWWFWQRKQGGFSLIDYAQGSGWDAEEWIDYLQGKIATVGKLGRIWLPHDARAKTFQSKHSVLEQFIGKFGAGKVRIVPQTSKGDRINAARTLVAKCEFNAERCDDGLNGLRAWQFDFNEETGVLSKEPKHDWASHPGDAFSYGCQVMRDYAPEAAHEKPLKHLVNATLDELWPMRQEQSNRI